MLAQSVARYWYTLQVLPKSEERSISMPAGMGLWGDTGRAGGVGLSDLCHSCRQGLLQRRERWTRNGKDCGEDRDKSYVPRQ